MYINDSPIKTAKEDVLGRAGFAQSLGREIINWKDEDSIVIGLYGSWGSGKSSIINIALEEITKITPKKKKPIIVYFNPWNYSDQEKLVFTFLRELARSINYYDASDDAKKVGKELIAYSKFFVPLALIPPITGFALLLNKIFESVGIATKEWGELKEKPVEEFKKVITSHIKKLDRKIIIVIDDIDRLNRKEIRQIFQLVKQNANFSNVIYLLPFDHKKVAEALDEESYPGKSYIEKIVQIPFNIPQLELVKLRRVLFQELDRLIKPIPEKDWDNKHWGNVYNDGFKDFFSSLRQVKRFVNSLEFNFSRISDEVNPVDFIALEAIRIFCPEVYDEMSKNKSVLTKTESSYIGRNNSSDEAEKANKVQQIFNCADTTYREQVTRVLKRLFPQIGGRSNYGHEWQIGWNKEKRICAEDRFDKYFLLGVPENETSQKDIDSVVSVSSSVSKVKKAFLKLNSDHKAKNFLEKLSLYLDEVPEQDICNFILGVYGGVEKMEKDQHSDPFNDTQTWCIRLGYNFIKRLTDKNKRLGLILELIDKTKNFRILSHFLLIEIRKEENKKYDEEKRLLEEKDVAKVKDKLAEKFGPYATSGKLFQSQDLAYMLYFWDFLVGTEKVSKYVKSKTNTLSGIATLLQGFMWSQSSTTMGDYVSEYTWKVNKESLKKFVDVDEIKVKLVAFGVDKINKLSLNKKKAITLFLENSTEKNNEDKTE